MNFTLPSRLPLVHTTSPASRSLDRRFAIGLAASLFVALCAHISIPMGFTPVPATLQTLAVILVGLLLGPVDAFAALTLYLFEGAAGLPVFSPHGLGGVAQLMGPTAGYLFSYPLAAAVAGFSVRLFGKRVPAMPAAVASGVLASLPVFTLGTFWLAFQLHLTATQALHFAITPFIAEEAVKITLAAAAFTALKPAKRS